jgi:hypothetical protein
VAEARGGCTHVNATQPIEPVSSQQASWQRSEDVAGTTFDPPVAPDQCVPSGVAIVHLHVQAPLTAGTLASSPAAAAATPADGLMAVTVSGAALAALFRQALPHTCQTIEAG